MRQSALNSARSRTGRGAAVRMETIGRTRDDRRDASASCGPPPVSTVLVQPICCRYDVVQHVAYLFVKRFTVRPDRPRVYRSPSPRWNATVRVAPHMWAPVAAQAQAVRSDQRWTRLVRQICTAGGACRRHARSKAPDCSLPGSRHHHVRLSASPVGEGDMRRGIRET